MDTGVRHSRGRSLDGLDHSLDPAVSPLSGYHHRSRQSGQCHHHHDLLVLEEGVPLQQADQASEGSRSEGPSPAHVLQPLHLRIIPEDILDIGPCSLWFVDF
ncbi:hypothetical protein CDAR_576871 [Caerostris darwini]|uniref:Uncharacterized protein n=1 Tax=Caerostris darwini TaxID=1538125 RepID=A0AAV4WPS2_9ARAC|nr:hypothetical protein CDAR_576871 [Caerostris darwini]